MRSTPLASHPSGPPPDSTRTERARYYRDAMNASWEARRSVPNLPTADERLAEQRLCVRTALGHAMTLEAIGTPGQKGQATAMIQQCERFLEETHAEAVGTPPPKQRADVFLGDES